MMTSRTEYRLILRQDNADQRLCGYGYELGLVSQELYHSTLEKYAMVEAEIKRLKSTGLPATAELQELLASRGEAPAKNGVKLADLLKRPTITYDDLESFDSLRMSLPPAVTQQVEIRVKYEGYIQRQLKQVEEFARYESHSLPQDLDYMSLDGLRIEARQKLSQVRPANVGQASRISGVSPADMAALFVYLEKMKNDDIKGA